MWSNASLLHHKYTTEEMDTWFVNYVGLSGELGVTALAVIFVVLIVIWMGYVKTVRWTWFVMFLIVWGWAFPLLIWPNLLMLLRLRPTWHLADFVETFRTSVLARGLMMDIVVFSLMLIALILPIRSFFWKRSPQG